MTPAAVLAKTNGREATARGDVEEVHTLFRWVGGEGPALCSASSCPALLRHLLPATTHPTRLLPRRDAKFSARLLMEQADKYIT